MRKLNTSDVFSLARLIKEIGIKEDIKKLSTSVNENTDVKEAGFDLIFTVIEKFAEKNSEPALYNFLSGPLEIDPEEVGKVELFTLVENILEIADIEKWKAFLKLAVRLDLIEIEELLLSRYSNIDYILKLHFLEGYEIILKAYDKEIEDRIWDRWLIDYKNMTEDNFINFEDYKSKLIIKNQSVEEDKVTKEELLLLAEEIENKISQKRGEE